MTSPESNPNSYPRPGVGHQGGPAYGNMPVYRPPVPLPVRRRSSNAALAIGSVIVIAVVMLLIGIVIAIGMVSHSMGTNQAYKFGHDSIGPMASTYVTLGYQPQTLAEISTNACDAAINAWMDSNTIPSWWNFLDVQRGCVDYEMGPSH